MVKKIITLLIALILYATLILYTVYYGPYPATVPLGDPSAYKNTYIHVPIAVSSYLLFTVAMIYSILYIKRKSVELAEKSHNYIIVGLVLATLTLAQGSLWAKESWGTYWNWDPRETGILLLWLSYLVYLAIRNSITDREKMLRVSSAYAIAAYVMVPFSFSLPYVLRSLHPRIQETTQMMGGEALILLPGGVIIGAFLGFALAEFIMEAKRKSLKTTKYSALAGIFISLLLILMLIPSIMPWFIGTLKSCSIQDEGSIIIRGIVVQSFIRDDQIELTIKSGECLLKAISHVDKIPLTPLVVSLEDNETIITINNHNVLIEGVLESSNLFIKNIKVIENETVLINSILFSLTMVGLMIYSLSPKVKK